jgi:hypothetical protein
MDHGNRDGQDQSRVRETEKRERRDHRILEVERVLDNE